MGSLPGDYLLVLVHGVNVKLHSKGQDIQPLKR